MAFSLALSSASTLLSSPLPLSRSSPVASRTSRVSTSASRPLGARCHFLDKESEREREREAGVGKGSEGSSPLSGRNVPTPSDAVERIAREAKSASESLKKSAPEETPLGTSGTLGFTKKNELFVGRMAMLGFTAAVVSEMLTGKGVFGQLNLYTGASMTQTNTALLIFISLTVAGAMWATGTRGYSEADPGQPLDARSWRDVFGLKPTGRVFGLNVQNEYLHGRIAQLGFVGVLLGEIATGRGPIGQLSLETSTPTGAVLASLEAFIVAMLLLSVDFGQGRNE